ncbi:two-component sensor histidine kinase [Microcoleus sp. FACHB-1515]|uniref:two-component system sensor histidine kinase RppB n=1 Tax=Cyanophyceae TaxID=3028117 RepID=UPI0016841F9E|nr:two-component system sensor histidine kinase RppB [Microcoleus sp. FACHB-1515]MBD2093397.1 two-component sensor histidine kinase [Microcoleus sp. FACHB-1515]
MHKHQLFNRMRWRLTAAYAGIMGVILSLSGLAVYEVMDRVHWRGLHQELQLVAGTLHDGLEPKLTQPGQIGANVEQTLPGLCRTGRCCVEPAGDRHLLGVVQQAGYYVRFIDLSGKLVATLGCQSDLPIETQTLWQTLQTPQGDRYHQISLLLKNSTGQPWGYMQVGQSLREFDGHLDSLRQIILLGLPPALLLITLASWWLAGRAIRPVYQSYQQIHQFTADAAHELRTPLAAMRATLESVLEMPQLPETESRPVLHTIDRQTNRLSQLVQDLLLLSRMDLQRSPIVQQKCGLNDLVNDVVEEFAALAIAADVLLIAEARLPVLSVAGSEEQLYRLLANLVTNAIQYTPPGGKVKLSLTQIDHEAVIQVQDTGIGIAAAEQSRIFDRFYRVNSDRSRQTGGAGLGLAIAQAIAQAHQGKIQVQSDVGKGSVFSVCLPLRAVQEMGKRL